MIGLSSTRRIRFAMSPSIAVIEPGSIVRRTDVAASKTKIEVLLGGSGGSFGEVPAAVVLERSLDDPDAPHHRDVAQVRARGVIEDLLHEDGALLVTEHEALG